MKADSGPDRLTLRNVTVASGLLRLDLLIAAMALGPLHAGPHRRAGAVLRILVVNSVSFDIKVGIGAAAGLAVVGVLAMFLPGTGKWFERDRGRISPPIRPG